MVFVYGIMNGNHNTNYAFRGLIGRKGILKGLPNPFLATRYHSLVGDKKSLPDCLEVVAVSKDDKEIMAVQHKTCPIFGVQFHPEAIMTQDGMKIIKNFLGDVNGV